MVLRDLIRAHLVGLVGEYSEHIAKLVAVDAPEMIINKKRQRLAEIEAGIKNNVTGYKFNAVMKPCLYLTLG